MNVHDRRQRMVRCMYCTPNRWVNICYIVVIVISHEFYWKFVGQIKFDATNGNFEKDLKEIETVHT